MAVQAQYPSNFPLFNRSEQDRKEMIDPTGFLDYSPVFLNGGVNESNNNQRKRGRETSNASNAAAAVGFQMMPTPQMNLFTPSSNQSPTLINLAQLQTNHPPPPPPPPPLVSTGLRLAFEDNKHTQSQSQSNLYFQDDNLSSLINQQKDEIDHLLIAHGEQLRRTLAERQQRYYRALLAAAEETAVRKLREKEVELNRAARRTAELEEQIARLRTESLTWQAKAMSDQATAANLNAQIRQVQEASKRSGGGGKSGAEDCESAHVDPNLVEDEPRRRACLVCYVSDASVVLLPCRHLCLCPACDAAVADSDAVCCPVCHVGKTGSVQVFLS